MENNFALVLLAGNVAKTDRETVSDNDDDEQTNELAELFFASVPLKERT